MAENTANTKASKVGVMTTREEVMRTLSGCSITYHVWGIRQAVDREEQEVMAKVIRADARAVAASKVKIDTAMPEWRAVMRVRSSTRLWFETVTFPYVVAGQRLFRIDMKDEIWKGVAAAQARMKEAAAGLQAKRKEIIAWGKNKLGDAFDERDYPLDLSRQFAIEIREHSINPPDYLATEDRRRFEEQIMADVKASMTAFERRCMDEIGHAVGMMHNALQGGDAPHHATLSSLQEAFNRVARMRFQGTAMFNSCVKDINALMDDLDPTELRRSFAAKEAAKARFADLLKRYKQLAEKAAELKEAA